MAVSPAAYEAQVSRINTLFQGFFSLSVILNFNLFLSKLVRDVCKVIDVDTGSLLDLIQINFLNLFGYIVLIELDASLFMLATRKNWEPWDSYRAQDMATGRQHALCCLLDQLIHHEM